MEDDKLRRTLLYVLNLLVQGQYEMLERFSVGRLTALQIQEAVEEWPYRLTMPAKDAVGDLVYGTPGSIKGANPLQWWVDVNLWTAEEGRSDLTLSLTLTTSSGEYYQTEIDNIHVL